MYNIPNIVNRMPHTKLFALRILVTPNFGDTFKVAVYLELEKMLNELQVMSVASSKWRIDFEVDKIKRSLKDLKDSAMEKSFSERLDEIRQSKSRAWVNYILSNHSSRTRRKKNIQIKRYYCTSVLK